MKNIGYSFNGFTTSRLKRFLTTGGQSYQFIEWELNQYNEPTSQVSSEKAILGVLHRSSSMSTITSDSTIASGSKTRTSPTTSIITSWESLVSGFSGGKELSPGMETIIDGFKYKIVKVENLNAWGLVAEISLEVYDGWEH